MPSLLVQPAGPGSHRHEGEVLCCAFGPDGTVALSGGWEGNLLLWEAASGALTATLQVSDKPVTACRPAPGGESWLIGSLDGMLADWDAVSHHQLSVFLAHARPISAIVFAPDGQTVATASWDSRIILWTNYQKREGRPLTGHADIVAGCCFTPDGQGLLSWSYDQLACLWEVARARPSMELAGHTDRVTAGAVSPDGRWALTGARDGGLKLWDLLSGRELRGLNLGAEIRVCLFLLDGQSAVVGDDGGRLKLLALPDLEDQAELLTGVPVQCAELAPAGNQIVLGCRNGQVQFVGVDGFDRAPLVVVAARFSKRSSSTMGRLLGKEKVTHHLRCRCPVCRHTFEVPAGNAPQPLPCPSCLRALRVSEVSRIATEPGNA